MTNLQQELSRVISVAFANEEAFLKWLFTNTDYNSKKAKIKTLCINDKKTRVYLSPKEGFCIVNSVVIATTDYLSWVAEIEGEKG